MPPVGIARGWVCRSTRLPRRRVLGAMLDELRSLDRAPRSVRRMGRELDATVARLRHELGREPTETEIAGAMNMSETQYRHAVDQLRSVESARCESSTQPTARANR